MVPLHGSYAITIKISSEMRDENMRERKPQRQERRGKKKKHKWRSAAVYGRRCVVCQLATMWGV